MPPEGPVLHKAKKPQAAISKRENEVYMIIRVKQSYL